MESQGEPLDVIHPDYTSGETLGTAADLRSESVEAMLVKQQAGPPPSSPDPPPSTQVIIYSQKVLSI